MSYVNCLQTEEKCSHLFQLGIATMEEKKKLQDILQEEISLYYGTRTAPIGFCKQYNLHGSLGIQLSLNSEWHYEPRQVMNHTSEIEKTTYGQTHKLSVGGPEKQYTGSFHKNGF